MFVFVPTLIFKKKKQPNHQSNYALKDSYQLTVTLLARYLKVQVALSVDCPHGKADFTISAKHTYNSVSIGQE